MVKRKKGPIILCLLLVAAGGISGCGQLQSSADLGNGTDKHEEGMGFPWHDIMEAGIRFYTAKQDVTLDICFEDTTEEDGFGGIERETVKEIAAKGISSTEISIMWNGIHDSEAVECEQYILMRRGMSANIVSDRWEKVAVFPANQTLHGSTDSGTGMEYEYGFTDVLESSEPMQYEYRLDIKTVDGILYTGAKESTAVASNVRICIDPGHYKGSSEISDKDRYNYEEGVFTLRLGLALQEELVRHGIESYLTRETDSITIDHYTNEALDRAHLSLRGEYAAGSNLFISIHTNANNENVNGCDTWQQPLGINKTVIILNQAASDKEQIVAIANAVGTAVTAVSHQLGLSVTDQFEQVEAGSLLQWTSDYNDSVNVKGTVCYRLGNDGDYYGVLRGAANVDVPGMIIEHGFHTVEEMRRQAVTEGLAEEWAKADADGIAEGLGFK